MAYTAEPEYGPDDQPIETAADKEAKRQREIEENLLSRIGNYIATHHAEDFALATPKDEKTVYTELHRNIKKHGGKPPMDYQYAEDLADLNYAFMARDLVTAISLFYRLKATAP